MKRTVKKFLSILFAVVLMCTFVLPASAAASPGEKTAFRMPVKDVHFNSYSDGYFCYLMGDHYTIRVHGMFAHSEYSAGKIRSGICHKANGTGSYVIDHDRTTMSGESYNLITSTTYLEPGLRYYGFVKNLTGGRVSSGELVFYYR